MSQQQKKRKWKTFGRKSNKEAASNVDVVQSKLRHLDEIFAGSSAEEDGSHGNDNSYQSSDDEGETTVRRNQSRSEKSSQLNSLFVENHSDEHSFSGSSGSVNQTKHQRNIKSLAEVGEEVEEDDIQDINGGGLEDEISSDAEASSRMTEEEAEEVDSGTERSDREEDFEEMQMGTTETTKAQNMAKAMARLLGETSSSNTVNNAVILSKTTTKIQKLQAEAKKERTSLSLKRSERKQINLSAMYIPPPVHNSSSSKSNHNSYGGASSTNEAVVAQELQNDRAYRRIATRGVVALFNAISQHQREQQQQQKQEVTKDSSQKITNPTISSQHDFIHKIKESALVRQQHTSPLTVNNDSVQGKLAAVKNTSAKSNAGWNALKDDYMLTSNNLKDWDKDDKSATDSDDDNLKVDCPHRSNLLINDDLSD